MRYIPNKLQRFFEDVAELASRARGGYDLENVRANIARTFYASSTQKAEQRAFDLQQKEQEELEEREEGEHGHGDEEEEEACGEEAASSN